MNERFDVLAEVWPSFGCVVDLLVALGEDDGVLDGVVRGTVVHGAVGWVAEFPVELIGDVRLDIGREYHTGGGRCGRSGTGSMTGLLAESRIGQGSCRGCPRWSLLRRGIRLLRMSRW